MSLRLRTFALPAFEREECDVSKAKYQILRLPAVMERVGVSRETIYRWAREGSFPKPVKLGELASGWLEAEVEAAIAARVEARNERHA